MKPQKQLSCRFPELSMEGDCHRTAIAIIFGLDAEEVPHFCEDSPSFQDVVDAEKQWLLKRGFCHAHWVIDGDRSLEAVLEETKRLFPGSPVMVMGSSERLNHVAVALDGKIFCDPATGEARTILVGPADDGLWWVTIFTVAHTWSPERFLA